VILAANFKMNHTRASTKKYIQKLNSVTKPQNIELFIFPPFTALDRYESIATIGAQNGFAAKHGSYTGEIGLEQLREFDIMTILLGHSERRHLFSESQELIVKKFVFYKKNGFRIFYCVGEPLEVRQDGKTKEYIQAQLEGIDLDYEKLIIAYEPVWAIGTGVSAKAEEISEVLAFLSQKTKAPLLYGGSVKPENIKEILTIPNCDGALIGTASWDVESFIAMIEKAKEI